MPYPHTLESMYNKIKGIKAKIGAMNVVPRAPIVKIKEFFIISLSFSS